MAGIQKFEKGKAMAIACLGDVSLKLSFFFKFIDFFENYRFFPNFQSCMRLPIDCSALTIEDPKNAEILKITVGFFFRKSKKSIIFPGNTIRR